MTLARGALVERERALAPLDELLQAALRDRGGVAVISGLPGAGKTSLLQEFTERAAVSGARILFAIAARDEKSFPLAVIDQLLDGVELPAELAARLPAIFDQASAADAEADAAMRPAEAPVVYTLCRILLQMAAEQPVVIAVDDVQHADRWSVRCLSHLARRLRNARMLVLLTVDIGVEDASTVLPTDLLRTPYCLPVELEPVSAGGIRTLLERECLLPPFLSDRIHAVTGGNPLLMRAVIEDHRNEGRPDAREIAVGDVYAQAVTRCLRQSDQYVQQLAQELAIMDGQQIPERLAGGIGLDAEVTRSAQRLLERMGLLHEGRFRHDRARKAILAQISATDRAVLHRNAAGLRYASGDSPAAIAQHLVLAGRVTEQWAPTVLKETAAQLLADGQLRSAAEYLEFAHGLPSGGDQHLQILVLLARVLWRINPLGVRDLLPELVAAARARRLTGREISQLTVYLGWHGEYEQAVHLLTELAAAEDLDAEMEHQLEAALLRLAYFNPAAESRRSNPDEEPDPVGSSLLRGYNVDLLERAAEVVKVTPLNDDSLCQVYGGLLLMTYGEGLPGYPEDYDNLLRQAREQGAQTWTALLHSVRGEIELRRGNLSGAAQCAQESLNTLTPKGWGVAVGAPLSCLIRSATISGRYEVATGHLDVPVPASMFRTPFGAMYLHARGSYYLAVKRIREAVNDLETCGALMTGWGIDVPGFMPWRSDLAAAHVAMGRPDRGRELATAEVQRLDHRQPRTRAKALRVLAAASEPQHRLQLLREATDLLQSTGDQLEQANTLADLSEALEEAGQSSGARRTWRAAQGLAKQFDAMALVQRLENDFPSGAPTPGGAVLPTVAFPEFEILSDAERRVAALAARGDTNREIARKLCVTVSTVEQHLTRVYRKLNVGRRRDLEHRLSQFRLSEAGRRADEAQATAPSPAAVEPRALVQLVGGEKG